MKRRISVVLCICFHLTLAIVSQNPKTKKSWRKQKNRRKKEHEKRGASQRCFLNLICKSAYFTVENLIGCNSFVNRVAGQDIQFGYEGNAYLEYKHALDEVWLNKPTRINSALNFSGGSSETVIYEQMVLTSNVLYIKNTQALQTPKIIFQVGSTEVFQIEENTTRVKKYIKRGE